MTTSLTIAAETRAGSGKSEAKRIRDAGRVPAIIYGAGKEPEPISVEIRSLEKSLSTGKFLSTLCTIEVGGAKTRCLPRDVHFHPVSDRPLHVDFMRIAEGATVTVMIPVHFRNEQDSPGLKSGGMLNIVRHEVELVCPIDGIPDEIVVDLTGWQIGGSIHISHVALPEGTSPAIADRDFTIATLVAPSGLKSDEAEGEAAAAG